MPRRGHEEGERSRKAAAVPWTLRPCRRRRTISYRPHDFRDRPFSQQSAVRRFREDSAGLQWHPGGESGPTYRKSLAPTGQQGTLLSRPSSRIQTSVLTDLRSGSPTPMGKRACTRSVEIRLGDQAEPRLVSLRLLRDEAPQRPCSGYGQEKGGRRRGETGSAGSAALGTSAGKG